MLTISSLLVLVAGILTLGYERATGVLASGCTTKCVAAPVINLSGRKDILSVG